MNERRKLERHHVSNSLEVYDLDSGELLGRVVDLHTEGLMLLSERPIELNRSWALQVNLPMNLNGVSEFMLDAESRWDRKSLASGQYWTGLQFTHLPEDSRRCIERMVSSR
ncbi:PilZ domain-containing protein [Pseudomonas sp. G11-1]|uniref:PilZ domain-containing protein n=1 Tax=Halopseudomonas bauzanensis TaxID=653930 RepID=A0A031MHW2_9GAMM|nr:MULTISPECIES: PilZ domain-containing protein [Halopseudomonas]MCO5787653.1 PilZ domain-containing protein [Pseudomonas sp. G11-1]MCO5790879.1 PilZ domain-containing protein [Pseudomonas sp. G11-2]EZQ20177.1 pilus assembly protein PilZ [Halopseudomonas bauzanensis]TKA91363.1 PilZ domain-containing protein [Halopseudomonas bauzanensis]WGK63129.1 PilZ domain-containing protein [Halopseudomonas sp. SMJS2]